MPCVRPCFRLCVRNTLCRELVRMIFLILDPRAREGPSYGFIAVRTFGFFSKLSHRNFLIFFCMKLVIDKGWKLNELNFTGKIWFSQNCVFLHVFIKIFSIEVYIFLFKIKQHNVWTILRKPHVRENSGSRFMAQNGINQSLDFSNLNISRVAWLND